MLLSNVEKNNNRHPRVTGAPDILSHVGAGDESRFRSLEGPETMSVPKPYEFIESMGMSEAQKLIGLRAMDVTKPCCRWRR